MPSPNQDAYQAQQALLRAQPGYRAPQTNVDLGAVGAFVADYQGAAEQRRHDSRRAVETGLMTGAAVAAYQMSRKPKQQRPQGQQQVQGQQQGPQGADLFMYRLGLLVKIAATLFGLWFAAYIVIYMVTN